MTLVESSLPKAEKYAHETMAKPYTQLKYGMVLTKMVEGSAPSAGNLLDVGCNVNAIHHDGLRAKLLSVLPNIRYVGIDIDVNVFNTILDGDGKNNLNSTSVCANVDHIPFPNKSFTTVLALDVMDHVSDSKGALGEIKRVLNPNSQAIFVFPSMYKLDGFKGNDIFSYINRYRHSSEVNHKRAPQWIEELQSQGFKIQSSEGFGFVLGLPYLFWAQEENVPRRLDMTSHSQGIQTDIIDTLTKQLSVEDIKKIDQQVVKLIEEDSLKPRDLIGQSLDISDEDIWSFWLLPAIIQLHPEYALRNDLQLTKESLTELIRRQVKDKPLSPEDLSRINYIQQYLSDPQFFLLGGGNALMVTTRV
ncbi:hypothetical protein A3D77_05830 [Candidatus Gottesmanbacteria bacterium RIFCSPHIGHO2_02_FULL_39_11]|uniref:Methyltransferase type 11 domain-containing protein n=1 Tax=Candidatus Gottesmanbacteria bacterium RIFCSPHIGHO2_02_FULL_39_11 TaxID=1798382 RepID=A0A1F5ZT66_9BACT|nr:MAG: hypothetical protein A3D77_05830 [Candidatus Gottesmanbacteria bacterium RIFCSPHIGHO2_02_FULL_39_11]